MGKIIIYGLCLFYFLTINAYAVEKTQGYEYCQTLDGVAKVAMERRQDGVPMVEVFNSTLDVKPKSAKEMIQSIIKDAYSQPIYNSDKYKKKEIDEFRSKIFRLCLSNI